MSDSRLLRMTSISKRFPGVQALHDVNFELNAGEVHVLMGENGAGKSTLMKILAGIYPKDAGTIHINGLPCDPQSPKESLEQGISMIHQELSPIRQMSIAENIFLGREPTRTFLEVIDRKQLHQRASEILQRMGISLPPDREMSRLSVAEMQMVEIAKATSYNSAIIIMDEPTSAISDNEVEQLFSIIGSLKSKGCGIVYISHKMDEIYRVSDRITVLRDGHHIGTTGTSEVSKNELISMMVGREISNIFPKEQADIGEVILEVSNLTVPGQFEDVSFELRRGEILGIAGLMGAGRTEVVETLFGLRSATAGTVRVNGKTIPRSSPSRAIAHGMGLVSEDRKEVGLVLKRSVRENTTLVELDQFSRGPFLQLKKERNAVDQTISSLSIKTPTQEQTVENLSGGNQQKVVIGKWLLSDPDILIMDEPTRGIDVGAKAEIHKLISRLAVSGKAILMVSSELPEIMGMSDRVIVMHEGHLTGALDRAEFSQERIMQLATGHTVEQ